jgi:hypothetical protein
VQKLGVTFTYSSDEIPDDYKTWVNISYTNDLADYTYSVDVVDGSSYFVIGGDTNLSNDAPEIPVIPTDIYSLAKGNIAILDINFLNGQSDKDEDELGDKIWLTIRNFISAIIRAVYYIVAALLLTSLIWHGINIVKGSLTPKAAQEHREGLNRFVKSLLMLVGTILIMALSIFASQMFLEDISDSDSEELPIRVCVTNYDGNGTTLSFSTNFTGYLRFMSETEDVTNCFQKGAYTLSYIVVAIFNSVAAFGMFLRMLVMMCLAIVGAVVVGRYALTNNEKAMTDYRIWAKVFITLALVQVVLAIIVRVLFECAL